MAFFALNFRQGRDTTMFISAVDPAGNRSRAGFPYYIRKKSFRKDILNITDRFLNWKMPEFDAYTESVPNTSPLEKFLKVNRGLRQENYMTIIEVADKTDSRIYWDGAFLRLPKSARQAGFADHRVYRYQGRIVDRQVHLGVDLASIERSPVPASNRGKVVFAERLGIYGKTIILDHGFGLFSMYSHLSSFSVQPEHIVSKGEPIGYTGMTGLAGGDHLHFGVFIHDTFVDPIEWWDASWIENNISSKIMTVKSTLGE
jgi:murein DD-endopeptidase MepM/ murein hydrolase activator NlpD